MAGPNIFDPERVREHRQNVKMALGSCLKTAKIMCKFVELPCFHCPAYVLTPDDLPALEVYKQQILERIEIGKQAGNGHWIEVNQKNLDERIRPAIAFLKQGHVVAKTDKQEREYTDEEWEQRKHQSGGSLMSEKTWERNTTGLAIHAQRRKEHKRKGVEEAIQPSYGKSARQFSHGGEDSSCEQNLFVRRSRPAGAHRSSQATERRTDGT